MKKLLLLLIITVSTGVLFAQSIGDLSRAVTTTKTDLLVVEQTDSTRGIALQHLFAGDSLYLPGLATSDIKVLSPTSTGGTKSLETALGTAVTWPSLDVNELDINTKLSLKHLATSNTVLLTIDSNGDIDTIEVVPSFATAAMVGGTANAITIDFTPDYPTLSAGDEIMFVAEAANTGATTLNIDGTGAKNVYEASDISALEANDIRSGMVVKLVYDGTQFQQISQSGN